MTVPLDMGITFGIGMTFGMAGEEEVKNADSVLETKAYRKGLLYNTAIGVGIAAACYLICPDWMLMYYADHRKISKPVKLGMFSLYNLMYTLGFLAVRELESKQEGLARAVFGCCLAYISLFTLFAFKRIWNVGTVEEFENGEAKAIIRTPLAPLLMGGGAGAVALLVKMMKDIVEETSE